MESPLSTSVATTTGRIHNFAAGPAVLPVPVLERMRDELLNWNGSGMSVMEMSHRSAAFESIIQKAEADLRALTGLSNDYAVLFVQGGGSLAFSMLPMNFRPQGASADYILTGAWSKAALKEAQKTGATKVAGSSEADGFKYIPAQSELKLDPTAAYLHFTSNNTIYGTEWSTEPVPPPGVPLVCDVSSDMLSKPIDTSKYGVIYGGAQKNLGPAGVVIVIIRQDLLARVPANLPSMLDYKLIADNKSLYNTPPCFTIYAVGLVLDWLRQKGGLAEIEKVNVRKAKLLYDAIDASGGYYRGHARSDSRSRMNVTFRLPSEELEKAFVKRATAEGLDGLKGHRSVGGLRASIYNALPIDGVEALVQLMKEFQRSNG
jgi:phosphoserine aminotransferase